jgi:hypothetical protein
LTIFISGMDSFHFHVAGSTLKTIFSVNVRIQVQ